MHGQRPSGHVLLSRVRRCLIRGLGDRPVRTDWVQTLGAGVDGLLFPALVDSDIVLTSEKGHVGPHLAEQATGNRDFINGTLAQLILGETEIGSDRPKIFSPFGLGVLDLSVGLFVHGRALERRRTVLIDGFFGETERWSRDCPAPPQQPTR